MFEEVPLSGGDLGRDSAKAGTDQQEGRVGRRKRKRKSREE